MNSLRNLLLIVGVLVTLDASSAFGQVAPGQGARSSTQSASTRPWADGVSPKDMQSADRLRGEANALCADGSNKEALRKYRQALKAWDHPALHYAIARVLFDLDRLVEAYDHILVSLQYGPPPLGGLYQKAKKYQRLIENQIATLSVSCPQRDVSLSIDGQSSFTCRKRGRTLRLRSGSHKILGKKAGYLTYTRSIELSPNKLSALEVKLTSHDEATETVSYWDLWVPWAVAGSGVALSVVGGLFELQAQSARSEYVSRLKESCWKWACADNFAESTIARARRDRAIAVTGMTIGGAALVAGIVGIRLNQPKSRLRPEVSQIVPIVTAGGATIMVHGSF